MNSLTTLPPARPSRRSTPPRAGRRAARRELGVVAHPAPRGGDRGVDPLLNADEVAALLRMTKAWVYAETRAKRIPHVRLGRYVRYRRSAVLQWIGALERDSASATRW